ncbi:MAG: branched-chain amino acid ABC transporter permease [Dethiobacter sp.]|jgi:branched-chain amino acid transport system permease protein|nr:MAG: branched-chain amino acid ABC transporter permease [Dethiobacter sp.]
MDFSAILSQFPDLYTLAGQFFVGMSRAMILFVVAAGLTVVMGVLRIVNFTHGTFYMLGAFIAFSVAQWLGGSSGFWLALLIAPLIVAALSFVVESTLMRRIYDQPRLMQLLLTYALVLAFNDLIKIVWGVHYKSMANPIPGSISLGGATLPSYNLILLAAGPLVALGLWFFMSRTMMGKLCRATATDREMVDALGINSKQVFASVFVLGCYLAGLGGTLIAPTTNIVIGMGMGIIINAILVVVVGGLGNVWGALVVSFIFGIGESFGVLFAPRFALVFPFLIAATLLMIRPSGLMKSVW